ncbi:longevity assurance proteins LAG1/LAC1 [Crassisporium funariophilum]|nr:longevity assurance proteins LAG1/LAC1 [Crassisporium funariophilum]
MPTVANGKTKRRAGASLETKDIETDPNHHLTGSFLPQTPLGSSTPERSASPAIPNAFAHRSKHRFWTRWAVDPSVSIKLLILPVVLYANWELLSRYFHAGLPNPFGPIFLITGYIPTSEPGDPHYQKTYWDIAFVAYYIVFFSFVREMLAIYVSKPAAKYFGLKRSSKVDRFGEQTYALVYFMFFGAWGYRVMSQLPTFWYNTQQFWEAYPQWQMTPELKRYYLMQFAYWWQQLLVLVLGLEKPRKDYWELVAHHFVTLWLIGWSYLVNCTWVGNAVYMSMDIPDTFLAFSKLLNYIQWDTAKVYAFGVFFAVWTYFRHYLNLKIIWSVAFEQPNIPEHTKQWNMAEGVYMPGWMQSQILLPLAVLQCLNLFWYYYMTRILYRAVRAIGISDDRSDDEDEGEADAPDEKED